MTRIVINGAKGQMGQMLITCAKKQPEQFQVVGQIDLGDDLRSVIGNCDAVVDFSFHDATTSVAMLCAEYGKALVIGTTGHNEAEKAEVKFHKSQVPIVWASNYSTGVNTLFWLTRKAAEILGRGFDLELVEMHHRLKKDAPSGTAARLGEIRLNGKK